MSSALNLPVHRMSVAEFLDWDPGEYRSALWQLRDGEPEMMAPASNRHGAIQAFLAHLLTAHLLTRGGPCHVVTAPGVMPAHRADENCLIPDLGVTCAPPTGGQLLPDPLLLVEILSPANVSKTRANIRAYRTIPTVMEIVVLRSTAIAAEVLRRGPDGAWPNEPELLDANATLRLESIGYAAPLRDAYRTSGLV